MKHRSLFACLVVLVTLVQAQVPGVKQNRVLLPNGWWLSPAGEQIRLGDFPLNAALSEDGRYLAVTHSGQSKAQVMLVDLKQKEVVQAIQLKDSWLGITFVGPRLFVSGGYQNCVYTFKLEQGSLVPEDTIKFVEGDPKYQGAASGLDVRGQSVAIVFRGDSTIRSYNLTTKQKEMVKLDGMPYGCRFLKDGSLLVSIWSSKKLEAYQGQKLLYECTTGDHPNEIITSRDERYAYVACANDNTVSIIDLVGKKAVASISTAVYPDAPEGSTTNSVALSPDGKVLLAANADNNSLSVISVENPERPRPMGFIPVGWYPTKVMVLKNNTVLVLNGKGGRSMANPKREYIASLFPGSLSIFPLPGEKQLDAYTKQVFANTPYEQSDLSKLAFVGENPVPKSVGEPSPIKHILYIIKENRTYDQVFGDMPEGNGDTSLCLFNERVTPNHHKLAREFVLFDNFYVNSEVSADGHNWSTAAYATDYIEKTWPIQYGGRGGQYDFEGTEPTGRPAAGYLWTLCGRHNVSFRMYGEFIDAGEPVGAPGKPRDPAIGNHFDPYYRGWDLEYSDVERYKAWEKEYSEFEENGNLPSLCIMHLPNDHTSGTRKGALTPSAYLAQNDYALGLIVDRISKSKYWKESAIFVVEDDAQDGPDHVDAHRSVALVISPYTKRHFVDHTLYSTTSMLRTMELCLGLPPLSQHDAAATPMFNTFTTAADSTSYNAEEPKIDLNATNKPGSYGQKLMEKLNLKRQDAVPDRVFNEIVWRAVKGTPMPAPRYSIFSRAGARKDDD